MSDHHSETTDDLSALAWVQEELRRSLESAHKALRRFIKDAEAVSGSDVDAVDPAVLRTAHQQIHQGVGALELVGLPAVASVLRASEAAVKRFVLKPQKMTSADVDVIEQTSFALLDYLQRLLAGKQISALALFPRYRDVQTVAGADRVHPADLWTYDWRWREVPGEPGVAPRAADASARTEMEQQMLLLMRGQQTTAASRMSDLCAGLGAGAHDLAAATLWRLAAGFFQSQALGLLNADVFSKRVASRLLAQLRIFERGETEVSERLAQDLLFFCAQSAVSPQGPAAPRVAAVREAYELADFTPVDYEVSRLGRFDPAWIAQAKKRVSSAKDAWSGVAGGEMHRLGGLSEQFSLVGDSLRRLYPSGEVLAEELQQAVVQTQQSGAAPQTPLAMEVATSVLYLESSLEDTDFDHPEQAQRVRRLAQRIANVRGGQTPDPLEAWMEELYRRVSDRQTMGSVVQELRASLAEVEKHIDQFFRKPAEREPLMPVPGQLSSMRGVMSVLGMDQATQALLRMREDVESLINAPADAEGPAHAATFDRLAGNLGALGFLIDMLGAQPQVAKSLFVFDAATGALSPLMGRSASARNATNLAVPKVSPVVEPRVIEQAQALAEAAVSERMPLDALSSDLERLQHEAQAADQPKLLATIEEAQQKIEQAHGLAEVTEAREQLSEALNDFVITAGDAVALDPLPLPTPVAAPVAAPVAKAAPAPVAAAPVEAGGDLADDPEMREIFLEEAREKVGEAHDSLKQLAAAPGDVEQLTAVRRAFHTFKGSSRMVGLKEFGDAAWACEQLYNTWLARQDAATPALLDFSHKALDHLSAWIEAIADMRAGGWRSGPLVQAAEAFGRGEPVREIAQPSVEAASLAPVSLSFEAPAAEAELPVAAPVAPVAEPVEPSPQVVLNAEPVPTGAGFEAPAPAALPELSFDLDLGSFDEAPAASAPSTEASAPVDELALPAAESVEMIELELDESLFADVMPAPAAPAEAAVPQVAVEATEVDFDFDEPAVESTPAPDAPDAALDLDFSEAAPAEAAAQEAPVEAAAPADDDQVRIVGPLRISIPLFNIYLNEADELSRKLTTEVAEWAMELHRPVGEVPIALAHSLAGSSATVGFADLSQLARTLEHALMRSQAIGSGTPEEGRLFVEAAEEIRRLLHQFAAGFLKTPPPELLERLAAHEVSSARRLEEVNAAVDAQPQLDDALPIVAPEPELSIEPAPAADVPVEDTRPGALSAAEVAQYVEPMAEVAPLAQPVAEAPAAQAPVEQAAVPSAAARESAFGALPELNELGQAEFKAFAPLPTAAASAAAATPFRADRTDDDDDIDAVDAVDAELFPIFEEEAEELLPQLASALRDWARQPEVTSHAASCMRTLHTFKGGARLAGAMRLGEMAHRLETGIEHLLAAEHATTADVERLQSRADALAATFDALKSRDAQAYADAADALASAPAAAAAVPTPVASPMAAAAPVAPELPVELPPSLPVIAPTAVVPPVLTAVPETPMAAAAAVPEAPELAPASSEIDWSRFADRSEDTDAAAHQPVAAANAAIRVRGPLLERMVNQAGEVSITRSRIEAEVGNIRGSLGDLTDNLERLRQQLRDIEFQAETQMISRQEAAKAAHEVFDPLESDRFTRFQELTRMMAESVNDVATVQRTLQRTLETTEDELAAQARLTRDLQDDLLRTRMVEFESQSDRLYRVVRQAAKETGKQVRLDIIGGSIEIDRGVLDRMTPAFEHLLRNCVTHGIESPDVRTAAGKDAAGNIVVVLRQEGNEVGVEFRDDGAGLNLQRIRDKAEKTGLIATGSEHTDGELANLIFMPGFSTAETVTELAGRGVGMDVVRSEVNAMGGRIETATAPGQGTSFTLVLPLTTAVTQVVMLRCGHSVVAVPATLIEIVRRLSADEIEQAYRSGSYTLADRSMLFFWFGALLQQAPLSQETGRTRPVVVVRSAQQRVALHVDEVLGTQEVVVKNLGPQLSRLPGLAGMTLLASGAVALIYNPVALATLYGDAARAATQAARLAPHQQDLKPTQAETSGQQAAPVVLVVDDSLTVRRVTQRLLTREGFRVILAKDGIEALERLAEERPHVVLSDIEMPRMDGFDLARNIRGDARLSDLPIIMITSRIAQKHRDYAAELGVDHYLGKPYSEEDLLALIGRYTQAVSAPA
ncbi:Hpt domain-containing protein [Rhizobacter sp. LjRoot28]|uniref:hybrid sensor histidine kinase/response regulator n=1 Tax=Rhizobacter sp. LjRoot28 TaxID=3342309 RepID=UPI003ECE1B55